MVDIAIIGLGTVGSGVYKIVESSLEKIRSITGKAINIKYACSRTKPSYVPQNKWTNDIDLIFSDPSVLIVIEVVGGIDFGLNIAKKAVENKKHLITANKDFLATHFAKLVEMSANSQSLIFFEASVCGSIPVVKSIFERKVFCQISSVSGILNGTTNFILTKMFNDGTSFDVALQNAQSLGYAEANPESDITGRDAFYKAQILSNISFGYTENGGINESTKTQFTGIEWIKARHIEVAKSLGYKIKLVFSATKHKISLLPCFVTKTSQLYNVDGSTNAVLIKGEYFQSAFLTGPGAGSLETGFAVVSDIIDILNGSNINSISSKLIAKADGKNVLNGNATKAATEKFIAINKSSNDYTFEDNYSKNDNFDYFKIISE